MDVKSMKVEEMVEKLRRREQEGLSWDDIIELCFAVMEQHSSPIEQSRAAVILSGIVKKGLGKRTKAFLADNPKLPDRVCQALVAAIPRMEGF